MQIYLKSVPVTNRLLLARIPGGRVLDVGGAPMPARAMELAKAGCQVTILDVTEPRQPLDERIRFLRMNAEDLPATGELFEHVILSNVLEHVRNPGAVLDACARALAPDGHIHLLVPNCESLNRRIGVRMGILASVREIPEKEKNIGHIHAFTVADMKQLLTDAGLAVLECFGTLFKPAPTPEMIQWPEERIQAFFDIAPELPPEICHEIYFRARKSAA